MNSELRLTGDSQVALGDLYVEASPRRHFPGNPLVILNACESAALSSSFYEGFLPYLIAKGARGVIGTEADTPAVFAAAWADDLRSPARGEQAGQAALAVRREFAERHRNVLGLLYALYCDGDGAAARPGVATTGRGTGPGVLANGGVPGSFALSPVTERAAGPGGPAAAPRRGSGGCRCQPSAT